jgi:hypothetical protein
MDREQYKRHVVTVSFMIWNSGIIERVRAGPWPYQGPAAFFGVAPAGKPAAYRTLCRLAEALFPLRALIKKMLCLEDADATWNYASICAMGCPAFAASHFYRQEVDYQTLVIAAFASRDAETLARVLAMVLFKKANFLDLRRKDSHFVTVFFEQTTTQYLNICNCLWYLCALGSVEMLAMLHARYNFIAEDFIDHLAAFSPMVGACNSDEQLPVLQWIVDTFGIQLTGPAKQPLKNAMVQTCMKTTSSEILLWLKTRFGLEDVIKPIYHKLKDLFKHPRCNRFVLYMFQHGHLGQFISEISTNRFLAEATLATSLTAGNIVIAEEIFNRSLMHNTPFGYGPFMLAIGLLTHHHYKQLSWLISKHAFSMSIYIFRRNPTEMFEFMRDVTLKLDDLIWLVEAMSGNSLEAANIIKQYIDTMPEDKSEDRRAFQTALDKGSHKRLALL